MTATQPDAEQTDALQRYHAMVARCDGYTAQANERFPGFAFYTSQEWSGWVVGYAIQHGGAARRNRGRYAGQKIHRLHVGYKLGDLQPDGTVAWIARPLLHAVTPGCGCTQGQHAGHVMAGKTGADVNCTRCRKIEDTLAQKAAGTPAQ